MAEVCSSPELLPSAMRVVPVTELQFFGVRLGENHEIVRGLKSLETACARGNALPRSKGKLFLDYHSSSYAVSTA